MPQHQNGQARTNASHAKEAPYVHGLYRPSHGRQAGTVGVYEAHEAACSTARLRLLYQQPPWSRYSAAAMTLCCWGAALALAAGPIQTVWMLTNSRMPKDDSSRP